MNKQGLLVYNQMDYDKNKWFANELITKAKALGLDLHLVLRENLILTIEDGHFKTFWVASDFSTEATQKTESDAHLSPLDVDFVINRTRDTLISTHFEKMGCKVFNSAEVTELCNHKGKTHQFINAAGIPSVKTCLGNVHYFKPSMLPFSYPVILKAVSGHGGDEVYKLHNEEELSAALQSLRTEDFVLQELCGTPGIDVRVFIMNGKILAAVKRSSSTSFKSNYSLGGSATAYTLKPEEKAMVDRILSLTHFDFVGIDFILDEEGQFLFNEIEDVVGTRTLYLNYDIDVAACFLEHIQHVMNS